jgi:hypothetical protein
MLDSSANAAPLAIPDMIIGIHSRDEHPPAQELLKEAERRRDSRARA